MMPSCDQIGVPIHFHSSTTSGSASLMSLRILLRVSPRQSPSSAILFEMSSDADWPWLAPDFFMFSSWKFQIYFICKTVEDSHVRLQSNVTAGVYARWPIGKLQFDVSLWVEIMDGCNSSPCRFGDSS